LIFFLAPVFFYYFDGYVAFLKAKANKTTNTALAEAISVVSAGNGLAWAPDG
jgi:hypothetical protein